MMMLVNDVIVYRRVVWAMIFLCSFVLCIYMIINSLFFLMTYPKSVDVSIEYGREVVFPAVTVCNLNQYRLVRVLQSISQSINQSVSQSVSQSINL